MLTSTCRGLLAKLTMSHGNLTLHSIVLCSSNGTLEQWDVSCCRLGGLPLYEGECPTIRLACYAICREHNLTSRDHRVVVVTEHLKSPAGKTDNHLYS